eukprot:TRINITY_DN9387_c0_g1_i1.p1 TRINITY_DN9387_c0_g1~~TRINITY_DN9387_c0_g1_i1.p1  ORF type:complete len:336 (-),score=55.52 TRINITY_DN9387_c0_g1_i1:23-1030(-)
MGRPMQACQHATRIFTSLFALPGRRFPPVFSAVSSGNGNASYKSSEGVTLREEYSLFLGNFFTGSSPSSKSGQLSSRFVCDRLTLPGSLGVPSSSASRLNFTCATNSALARITTSNYSPGMKNDRCRESFDRVYLAGSLEGGVEYGVSGSSSLHSLACSSGAPSLSRGLRSAEGITVQQWQKLSSATAPQFNTPASSQQQRAHIMNNFTSLCRNLPQTRLPTLSERVRWSPAASFSSSSSLSEGRLTPEQQRSLLEDVNSKFGLAREEIEMAMESKETVYFNEEAEAAKAAVEEVLGLYNTLLGGVDEKERRSLERAMGLKMEQLKGELGQLNEE